jgi:hypothetical protein
MDQYVRETSGNPKIEFRKWDIDSGDFPVEVSSFDQIFILDVIEHLKDPEVFMEKLRAAAGGKRPEIVMTTANVAFGITRLMLFFGNFNYGRKGILDRTHTRLFTFQSLRELFDQTGYKVLDVRGIPAPFPKAIGENAIGRALVAVNEFLIKVSKGFFSYQIAIRARAQPTVPALLSETIERSEEMKKAATLVA